jgi:hypothetical protein
MNTSQGTEEPWGTSDFAKEKEPSDLIQHEHKGPHETRVKSKK